ncbi:MAG: sodium/proline symporter [Bacteroidota bacterium]
MDEQQIISVAADGYTIAAFVGYLLILIGIGIYSSRFSSSGVSEFFIGGRTMNRFVVALSAVVSGRSSWLLLGVTGMAYVRGADAVWAVVGYIVVELFLFLYYARRLRSFSEVYDCITVPDFFAARFNDKNGSLRTALVVVFLIFMVGYVSAQFVAGGKAFASSFGLEQTTGIWISAAIILAYTVLGGFLAVSLTDMVQAVFMIIALVVLPIFAIIYQGGWEIVVQQLQVLDPTLLDPFSLSVGAFLGFLGIGLGSPGNPHILARYMSIDDSKQLRFSALIGTIWNVLMAWGALFIGLVARTYFPEIEMLPGADEEQVFPLMAQQMLHPVLFGMVVSAIFAAIMSTADSQLLVAASAVVRDVYEQILNKGEEIPQKTLVRYSRWVVALLVAVALVFGLLAQELVFWLVLFAWAGLGAALGPTSILALYWKRTTKAGIFAGLFTGTVVTIVWYYIPVLKNNLYELIPAFLLSALATYVVSLMTEPPAEELVEEHFEAMEG